jgi:hypothetical protein
LPVRFEVVEEDDLSAARLLLLPRPVDVELLLLVLVLELLVLALELALVLLLPPRRSRRWEVEVVEVVEVVEADGAEDKDEGGWPGGGGGRPCACDDDDDVDDDDDDDGGGGPITRCAELDRPPDSRLDSSLPASPLLPELWPETPLPPLPLPLPPVLRLDARFAAEEVVVAVAFIFVFVFIFVVFVEADADLDDEGSLLTTTEGCFRFPCCLLLLLPLVLLSTALCPDDDDDDDEMVVMGATTAATTAAVLVLVRRSLAQCTDCFLRRTASDRAISCRSFFSSWAANFSTRASSVWPSDRFVGNCSTRREHTDMPQRRYMYSEPDRQRRSVWRIVLCQ